MSNNEIRPYIADSEMIDALKLDISTADPEFEGFIKSLTPKIADAVLTEFGPYIPDKVKKRLQTVQDRVILTNESLLNAFREGWFQNTVPYPNPIGGLHSTSGGVILVWIPEANDNDWDSQDNKEGLIEKFGDKQTAIQAASNLIIANTIAHEIVHDCQATGLYGSIIEDGTYHYQRELSMKYMGYDLSKPDQKWRALVYKNFLIENGERVHRVFFGAEKHKDRIWSVNQAYAQHRLEQQTMRRNLKSPES